MALRAVASLPFMDAAASERVIDMVRTLTVEEWGEGWAVVARRLAMRGLGVVPACCPDGKRVVRVGDTAVWWQMTNDPAARTDALSNGIGDVIGPWMHVDEAVARISRLAQIPAGRLIVGCLTICRVERRVWRDGRPISLLAREYELLVYLARHAGRAVDRVELLREIWGLGFDPGTNSIQVHMSRLRRKLGDRSDAPILQTIKGAGYVLDPGPGVSDQAVGSGR